MATTKLKISLLFLLTIIVTCIMVNVSAQVVVGGGSDGASWCVTRSDASFQALQTALDYACSAGADCSVLQPNGLCFLPNTIQAHASYAFNSFYQRKGRAPGSCDFSGTATVAQSDPSYGSCVYPSSAITAGGGTTPITTPPGMNNPNMAPPTMAAPLFGGDNPPFSDNNSRAPSKAIATWLLVFFSFILIMTLIS